MNIFLKNKYLIIPLLIVFFILIYFAVYKIFLQPRFLVIANNSLLLGNSLHSDGKIEEAIRELKKSVKYFQKYDGKNTLLQTIPLNNLGGILNDNKRLDEAIQIYSLLVSLHKDSKMAVRANIYNNLGGVYFNQQEYKKAGQNYLMAMAILEESAKGKADSTKLATTYNNIAEIYRVNNNFTFAISFFKKALEIDKIILGDDHLTTAVDHNNLANAYLNSNDLTSALDHYKISYTVIASRMGKDDPNAQVLRSNITYLEKELE